MKCTRFVVIFVLIKMTCFCSNPFEIDFGPKKDLTNEDYLEVQQLLSQINIREILKDLWEDPENNNLSTYGDFFARCGRGVRQVMTAPENDQFPFKKLYKINKGGNSCVVCCAPLEVHKVNRPTSRCELAKTIYKALEATGFNGYFYLRTGGYPNPTGEEIRYAGVPYAFKIFMMQEANQMGFNKILWIDSACLPIKNPKPLFDTIEREGALFTSFKCNVNSNGRYIFPATRKVLKAATGSDCLNGMFVCSIVLGLNFQSPLIQKFVRDYFELVKMGTPFLSCFPEEFVFSALLGANNCQKLHHTSYWNCLFGRAQAGEKDGPEIIERVKERGCFFYQRQHT